MASRIDRGDWERFRALGHAAPGIRDLVLSSWRRSDGVQGISSRTRARPALAPMNCPACATATNGCGWRRGAWCSAPGRCWMMPGRCCCSVTGAAW